MNVKPLIVIAALALSTSQAQLPSITTISVDFSSPIRPIPKDSFSINGFSIADPGIASRVDYGQAMAYLNAPIIRIHYAGLLNDSGTDQRGWVDLKNQRWDRTKIGRVMDAVKSWATLYNYRPKLLINIPTYPTWLKTYTVNAGGTKVEGLLDPSEFKRYAEFCADLVRFLNQERKMGIKYFELPNEPEDRYFMPFEKAGVDNKMAELGTWFNQAAIAMKKIDPSIQVGGAAFARGDKEAQVRLFLEATKGNLDFLSHHFYASGDLKETDSQIFARPKDLERQTASLNTLAREITGKALPTQLNEYNISWDWRNNDTRMHTVHGAIFDALSMIGALRAGASSSMAWNEWDGVYGKYADGIARPSADLFHLMNRIVTGQEVESTPVSNFALRTFASSDPTSKRKTVLLLNPFPRVQRVKMDFTNWTTKAPIERFKIENSGLVRDQISLASITGTAFELAANSVMFLSVVDKP